MLARANDVVDVFRDTDETDTDSWGDPIETGTNPHIAGLPMALTEYGVRKSATRSPADDGSTSQDFRHVRYARGRAARGTDLARGDVVVSRTTGTRWTVGQVNPFDGGVIPADVRVELVTP